MQSNKPKILIMDEDVQVLKVCQMVLSKAGFHPFIAGSPVEGLKALEKFGTFSAVLMDSLYQSPSTQEILQGLEKRVETCNIPVIVFQTQSDGLPFNTRDFPSVVTTLTKPFSPAFLLQTVDHVFDENIPTEIRSRRRKIEGKTHTRRANYQKPELSKHLGFAKKATRPALQGQIEFMPIPEILQLLRLQNQTGMFHVQKRKAEVFLFFQNGNIHFSTSKNLKNEFRLGRSLLQTRALKPGLLNQVLNRKGKDETPLGEYLVNHNYVPIKHLKRALKEQTQNILYELITWNKGSFSFEPLQVLPPLAKNASLELSVDGLILEGFRRVDEMKMMEKEVGNLQTILERTQQSRNRLEKLSIPQKNILANVNGSSTIEEIAERVHLSSFEIYKACQHLVSQKIVKRRPLLSNPEHYNA